VGPGGGLVVLEMRKKCLALPLIRTPDHTARILAAVKILNVAHCLRLISQHVSLMDMPPSADGMEKVGNLLRWAHWKESEFLGQCSKFQSRPWPCTMVGILEIFGLGA